MAGDIPEGWRLIFDIVRGLEIAQNERSLLTRMAATWSKEAQTQLKLVVSLLYVLYLD